MINNWLRKTRSVHNCGDGIVFDVTRPRIVCKDGYSVSVQAKSLGFRIEKIHLSTIMRKMTVI